MSAGDTALGGQTALLHGLSPNGLEAGEQRPDRAKTRLEDLLLITAIVGSGLLSGLYFIFSFCVMWALDKQPGSVAIKVMNDINVVIVNPIFLSVFMGTPGVCVALLCGQKAWATSAGCGTKRVLLVVVGCFALLLGEYGVTMFFNVPMNDALAKIQIPDGRLGSDDEKWAGEWTRYSAPWTAWNTFRMCASIVAVVCFSTALLQTERMDSEQ